MTNTVTASLILRTRASSAGSFGSSAGRTCKQPTSTWPNMPQRKPFASSGARNSWCMRSSSAIAHWSRASHARAQCCCAVYGRANPFRLTGTHLQGEEGPGYENQPNRQLVKLHELRAIHRATIDHRRASPAASSLVLTPSRNASERKGPARQRSSHAGHAWRIRCASTSHERAMVFASSRPMLARTTIRAPVLTRLPKSSSR